jgi:hypothetical protein
LPKHQVGDMVMRYSFQGYILGVVSGEDDKSKYPSYKIEWFNHAFVSFYNNWEMNEAKSRLHSYLKSQSG